MLIVTFILTVVYHFLMLRLCIVVRALHFSCDDE